MLHVSFQMKLFFSFFLYWTTLVITFIYYFICYILTFFDSKWLTLFFPLFPLYLRTGSSTSDELRLLIIARILATPVAQLEPSLPDVEKNFLQKSTWPSRDSNRGLPGCCESPLPPDHGDLHSFQMNLSYISNSFYLAKKKFPRL